MLPHQSMFASRSTRLLLRARQLQGPAPRFTQTTVRRSLCTMAAQKPRLTYYTAATPNGRKPSIVLEELGLEYETVAIDLGKNEQKEPWFLAVNPNGKIPALVDHSEGDFAVWESGAIMIYLVERYGKDSGLLPDDFKKRTEVTSWLMFQMGGLGPMSGQANYWLKFGPEEARADTLAQKRYLDETKRLYSVLEDQLKDNEWLAAGQYTIADIANFAWVAAVSILGDENLNLAVEYPAVKAWQDRILARPAVRKGLDVPTKNRWI